MSTARSSSGASRSSAGFISAQWNGALTASGIARLAPSAFARSLAGATASACPAITTCPGAFRLAGETTRPPERRHRFLRTRARRRPRPGQESPPSRLRRPEPPPACSDRGGGPCARHPRRITYRPPRAPQYSPRLWPAANDALNAARLDQSKHGDAHRQNRRLRVLGDLQRLRQAPRSTSCSATRRAPHPPRRKRRRQIGNASASDLPMPTFCAP